MTNASKRMSITNTNLLLAPALIAAVIWELLLNRKTYSHILLSESYLIFEGRLTKADGTPYANADEVALANNAIMHLFNRIEYHLSNELIESLNYRGQATNVLGLLKYPGDFSNAQGLNQLWYEDTSTTAAKADNNKFAARHAYLIQSPTVKGTVSFRIPLKHILVFVRTITKLCLV